MLSNTPSNDINDFRAFFRSAVGPDSRAQSKGASKTAIEQFIQLARFPLPPLYIGYLRHFGENDPVLKMAQGETRVEILIREYEEDLQDAETVIPKDCVLIATAGVDAGRALFYSDGEECIGKEYYNITPPTVVTNWEDEIEETCSLNFDNFIYGRAYVRGRIDGAENTCLAQSDERLLLSCAEFAQQLGFRPYWFCDPFQAILERDDRTALYVVESSEETLVYVSASTMEISQHAAKLFLREFGMRVP